MKIKKLLLAIAGVVVTFTSAFAAPAFIQHRQDCFKAVPASKGQIIFLGNSITNFHNWADAFVRPDGLPQDENLISNRGISDERAYHWKHNVQMMLDGDQQKIYDIQGRRVLHPSGGIYIQNGKKIVIKK